MSLQRLVDASVELLQAWVADPALPCDAALSLVSQAVDAYPGAGEEQRRLARAVLVNLLPVLARRGDWDAVQSALSKTIALEPDSDELRGRLGMLLTGMLLASLAGSVVDAADLPELWLDVAEASASEAVWEAVAAISGLTAVELARRGEFKLADRALAPLRHVPAKHAAATAAGRARAFRGLVVTALAAGKLEVAADAIGELRALARFAEQTAVDRPLAEALAACVRHVPFMVAVGRHAYGELARELVDLAARHVDERAVVAAFAGAASGLASTFIELSGSFLETLVRGGVRWRADATIVGNAALAIDRLARSAVDEQARTELWQRCAEALAELRDSCGADRTIVMVAARMSELTDRPMRASRAAAPEPRLHPDIASLRDLARDVESLEAPPQTLLAAFLGQGVEPLPYVAIHGPEIFARDEPYFLDLLDELASLLDAGWNPLTARVDAVTRDLAMMATPAVAIEAVELRERMGLATLVRLGSQRGTG